MLEEDKKLLLRLSLIYVHEVETRGEMKKASCFEHTRVHQNYANAYVFTSYLTMSIRKIGVTSNITYHISHITYCIFFGGH